jgi:hypothetical protein
MSLDNTTEATIALQDENLALKRERDDLQARLAKIQQDAEDKATADAKQQEATKEQETRNKLRQKPSNSFVPPTSADEALVRRLFGSASDARLANNLAKQDFPQYQKLRQVAVNLGLIA